MHAPPSAGSTTWATAASAPRRATAAPTSARRWPGPRASRQRRGGRRENAPPLDLAGRPPRCGAPRRVQQGRRTQGPQGSRVLVERVEVAPASPLLPDVAEPLTVAAHLRQ